MTEFTLCDAEHCAVPHEDFLTWVEQALCGKVYSPTPRPASKGHEALLIGYDAVSVTISAEFGDHRATVEIPTDKFDLLVDRLRESVHV